MRIVKLESEGGTALLCVLCTILVLSLIAGNVLFNCITRYNAASGQVRGWKEAIYAAEAGGDLGGGVFLKQSDVDFFNDSGKITQLTSWRD